MCRLWLDRPMSQAPKINGGVLGGRLRGNYEGFDTAATTLPLQIRCQLFCWNLAVFTHFIFTNRINLGCNWINHRLKKIDCHIMILSRSRTHHPTIKQRTSLARYLQHLHQHCYACKQSKLCNFIAHAHTVHLNAFALYISIDKSCI